MKTQKTYQKNIRDIFLFGDNLMYAYVMKMPFYSYFKKLIR